jgi:DNA polymerase III delta prime subunit
MDSINDIQLWYDKYVPSNFEDHYYDNNIITSINKWMEVFNDNKKYYSEFRNALLLSGAPGVGKTSLAHLLLKKWKYNILEFNASEIRTSKIICDKLESILSIRSITDIYNNKKTGIIMDELDGMEPKKECTTSDIQEYININKKNYIERKKIYNRKNKIKMTETEILKLAKSKIFINNSPIILITNTITHSIQSILKDLIHIEIPLPSNISIFKLLNKINITEKMNLNENILKLCIPYCLNDYRRTILLMWSLSYTLKDDLSINKVEQFLSTFGIKDIDMDIEYCIKNIYYNPSLGWKSLINMYYKDESFIPLIIHENFTNFMPNNIDYDKQLDICLEYYDYLYSSLLIKMNIFGQWENFSEYMGILTTVSVNTLLKPYMNDERNYDGYKKSAVISKYNYRYYNMKFINYICKKMSIDIDNFALLSCLLYNSIFINTTYMKTHLEMCAEYKLTLKELEKILKLCFLYDDKKYNKKKQKELNDNYSPLIANIDIDEVHII